MSQFSMSVFTNTNVKLANCNTVHTQVIGVTLCRFLTYPIIYPVGPFCYCPGHPSNTISSSSLNFILIFNILYLNILNTLIFCTLKVFIGSHIRISHIGVYTVYYETRAIFSSTNSQIYNKEEREHVKVIIPYKSVMDSNTFLFESARPKYIIVDSSGLNFCPCM